MLENEADKEQERKDLALLVFGLIDHIGDCLVDTETYLRRLQKLTPFSIEPRGGENHVMAHTVQNAVDAQQRLYDQFKHMLVVADRLNRYAKPTLYHDANERETERANKRWPPKHLVVSPLHFTRG